MRSWSRFLPLLLLPFLFGSGYKLGGGTGGGGGAATDLTCVGCVDDAELASNYSGVGACVAPAFVTGLNDNAAPTCDAIDLGTDTTGNYAAGDAEAGKALEGDTATLFFATGELERTLLPAASADCAADRYAKGIDADLVLDCGQVAHSGLSGLTLDDHTQYTKLAGRAGTTNDTILSTNSTGTLYGGGTSGVDLTLQANNVNTTSGEVNIEGSLTDARRRMKIGAGISGETITAVDRMLQFPFDYDFSTAVVTGGVSVINVNPTVHLGQASSGFTPWAALSTNGMSYLHDDNTSSAIGALQLFFSNHAITSSVANTGPNVYTLWDAPSISKTATGNLGEYQTIRSSSGAAAVGAVTVTTGNYDGMYWAVGGTTNNAGGSITIPQAAAVEANGVALSGSGTEVCTAQYGLKVNTAFTQCTTNVGVDVGTLTTGNTAIGLRNASTTVFPPTSVTNLGAAFTLTATSTFLRVATSGAGNQTSSATCINDGQDGQVVIIMNVDATDSVILTGGTNCAFAAAAATMTLGPFDNITMLFDSGSGIWLQVAQTNL